MVAIELKLGEFEPSHKGQMELYLKWLDKYEKQEGENNPIGLILCSGKSKEQIELLDMHKDGKNRKTHAGNGERPGPGNDGGDERPQ